MTVNITVPLATSLQMTRQLFAASWSHSHQVKELRYDNAKPSVAELFLVAWLRLQRFSRSCSFQADCKLLTCSQSFQCWRPVRPFVNPVAVPQTRNMVCSLWHPCFFILRFTELYVHRKGNTCAVLFSICTVQMMINQNKGKRWLRASEEMESNVWTNKCVSRWGQEVHLVSFQMPEVSFLHFLFEH